MTRATLIILSYLFLSFFTTGCESRHTDSSGSPPATANNLSPTADNPGTPGNPPLTGQSNIEHPSKAVEHPIPKSAAGKTPAREALTPAAPTERPLAVAPRVMELPTEALSVWRNFALQKPALVLLSNNPLLQPIPDEIAPAALSLAKGGNAVDLRRQGTSLTADPLLLPGMTLTAALRCGFFSRVIWIIPSKPETTQLSQEIFRKQLIDIGAASSAEAESFVMKQGILSGTLQGVPFLATPHRAMPSVEEAVLLHIDLSFFQPLYQGEIKTPLYPLLAETFSSMKKANWLVADVTISLSNVEGGVPLASRFVGADLAAFFRDPLLLDKTLPDNWARRSNALYLENFFQKEKVREMYLEMEEAAPSDPSVKYALYSVARQFNEGDKALSYLREAVRLDQIYAIEYLTLADLAEEKNLDAEILKMLESARVAFPDNPFISLHVIEMLLRLKHFDEAAVLIRHLADRKWSPVYYPKMPTILRELTTMATSGKAPAQDSH